MANISVKLDIKNDRVKGELEEVIAGMEGFHLQTSPNPAPCDLLIMEIGNDLDREFQNINSIQASGTTGEVFLTSHRTEPEILIQVLRTGAKEFFPQPIKKEEVKTALLKSKGRLSSAKSEAGKGKKGKIINVIGSKGGVGTTTVAVNLADSLKGFKESQSVVLIDMNLLFGEIPIFLSIESVFNWGEVARNISRVDSTYLMSSLSKHPSGLYVLPSPSGLDGFNVTTPQVIEKLLHLMQTSFDFIVIDSGQSLDDLSLKILQMSDSVLLVSILSFPCLINIKRLQNTFRKLGFPPEESVKIVMNRYHKKSLISPKEAEESLQKRIFWLIPNDYPTTMSAINQGKTLSTVAHNEEITKNFKELASAFWGREGESEEKSGFWRRKFL